MGWKEWWADSWAFLWVLSWERPESGPSQGRCALIDKWRVAHICFLVKARIMISTEVLRFDKFRNHFQGDIDPYRFQAVFCVNKN